MYTTFCPAFFMPASGINFAYRQMYYFERGRAKRHTIICLPLTKQSLFMKQGVWQQILTYFYIRKRDPRDPKNINIKFMHGMNRISLFMFLIAVIVMIVRLFTR